MFLILQSCFRTVYSLMNQHMQTKQVLIYQIMSKVLLRLGLWRKSYPCLEVDCSKIIYHLKKIYAWRPPRSLQSSKVSMRFLYTTV